MRVAHSGRARISVRHPVAMGECDRCSQWWSLSALSKQQQWAGNSLIDVGLLVCRECLDIPQDQLRSPILPADPFPRTNPRPSANVTPIVYRGGPLATTPENQSFSQYTLGASFVASGLPPALTQAGVLASVSQLSGVPTPIGGALASYIIPMLGNSTVALLATNATRSFLLIYNPTQVPAQISTGTARQGTITNLSIGPGETYFWATAQGLAPVYQGSMTAIGLSPGLPLWVWEDGTGPLFYNNGGVLALTAAPSDWPTSPVGLPIGSIWNNGLSVSVVGPTTPNPTAPPVLFGSITIPGLLTLGGANLPHNSGTFVGQLWNDNGVVAVSSGTSTVSLFTLGQSLLGGPDVLA